MQLIIQTPEGYTDQEHLCVTCIPDVGHEVLVYDSKAYFRFSLVVQSVLWDYENNQVFVKVK